MQYPESSQRTRIDDDTIDSRSSNTPSSSETIQNSPHKNIASRKRETPKPSEPRARVSSFLATVLLDWPPPDYSSSSSNTSSSRSPQHSSDSLASDSSASQFPERNYELDRSSYDGYRMPSLSTDTQADSPISCSSDSGFDRMSDFSDNSAYLPPPRIRRGSSARHGYHSDGDRGYRSSIGSIDDLKSWRSSEVEKSDLSPPKKPKKKSKMHQCEICGKWFPRPSGLRTHINTHTKARPYACWIPGCNKSFAARSNAKRHLLTHGIDTSVKGKGSSYLLDFTTPTVVESPTQSSDDARWSGNLRWMSPESATTDLSSSPKNPWLSA